MPASFNSLAANLARPANTSAEISTLNQPEYMKYIKPENLGFLIPKNMPPGVYVAICLWVLILKDVLRPTFNNPEIKKRCDRIRFLYGAVAGDGEHYTIQSREMAISGDPRSNLYKWGEAWNGEPLPYGTELESLQGRGAVITVVPRPGDLAGTTVIDKISPVSEALIHKIPTVEEFHGIGDFEAPGLEGQPPADKEEAPTSVESVTPVAESRIDNEDGNPPKEGDDLPF